MSTRVFVDSYEVLADPKSRVYIDYKIEIYRLYNNPKLYAVTYLGGHIDIKEI